MSAEQCIDALEPVHRDDARPKKIAVHGNSEASPSVPTCATLCEYCQDIFDHLSRDEDEDDFLAKHPDFSTMRRNAEKGCRLCHLLLASRAADQQATCVLGIEPIRVYFLGGGSKDSSQLPHWKIDLVTEEKKTLDQEDLDYVGHYVYIREESDDSDRVSLDKAIRLAKLWLKECCTDHASCKEVTQRFLPTRLIDVTGGTPHLVSSTEVEGFPPYATVSHCWGKTSFETLKRSNYDIFRRRIPAEALSRTFLDAIAVARGLGIPYIWIDSLCIMQDKPVNEGNKFHDWIRESARMCDVYRNSHLNIAATGAVDGNDGLFMTQNENYDGDNHFFNAPARSKDDRPGYIFFPYNMWDRIMCSSPLVQRAWVVQELILAPRTLHFARAELFWECSKKTACSRFQDRLPAFFYHMWPSRQKHPTKTLLQRYSWKTIVESYSRCKLTFGSDKMVAISGLARAMSTSQNLGGYLAGLWNDETLVYRLLWRYAQSDSQDLRPRSPEYRAPTWSWLSLDRPVHWYELVEAGYRAQIRYSRVISSERLLAGPDEFGPISYAALELECQILLPVTMGTEWLHLPTAEADGAFTWEWPDIIWATDESISKAKFRLWFDVPVDGSEQLYLLQLFSWTSWRGVQGLILKPVGRDSGCYERVGVFTAVYAELQRLDTSKSLSNPDARGNGSSERPSLVLRGQPAPPNSLPPTRYKRTQQAPDGSTTYVIRLI